MEAGHIVNPIWLQAIEHQRIPLLGLCGHMPLRTLGEGPPLLAGPYPFVRGREGRFAPI
jgi:hypothetical protein